ncbi:MAG: hypothetical protein CL938_07720 [Deltaproteobacteria bacterium]|nr:hypothetical protein [Deltaproteobacteria bacterium]
MDMGKYRAVFLEEATEHLAEMSRALLELEKDPGCAESVDVLFRMAHSIKGMAASLEYASITDISHRFEDRVQAVRSGDVQLDAAGLALLFRGLEGLERMVGSVRRSGMPPPPEPELAAVLALTGNPPEGTQKKA